MFKLFTFICVFVSFSNTQVATPTGTFLPIITPYVPITTTTTTNSTTAYTRLCKALCMLYIPESPVCGINNTVYANSCMATCDRVAIDNSRIMFNNKCCCHGGDHIVHDHSITSNNMFKVKDTATGNDYVVVMPRCISNCLGIYGVSDLVGDGTVVMELGP